MVEGVRLFRDKDLVMFKIGGMPQFSEVAFGEVLLGDIGLDEVMVRFDGGAIRYVNKGMLDTVVSSRTDLTVFEGGAKAIWQARRLVK
jgi:hypothetical protein